MLNAAGKPQRSTAGPGIRESHCRASDPADVDRLRHADGLGDWEQLLDFREVASEFALAKRRLALSGLSADAGLTIPDTRLRKTLEAFGGGIELTTLAVVPKGSGLGTSSIMGAVLLAVLDRVMRRHGTTAIVPSRCCNWSRQ